MTLRVALIVFPGFEILDLAALSVFDTANGLLPTPRYTTEVVSAAGGAVTSSSGVAIATATLGKRRFDTLLLAGASDVHIADVPLIHQLKWQATRVRRLASICTGAFILAQAGLLDGHRATTHWAEAKRLRDSYPLIRVEADRIYINDGIVWSSAGMTACIDLALAMVEADLGGEVVSAVARKMVVYHRRVGGQSQFSTLASIEPHSDRVRAALAFARQNLTDALTVEQLARHVNWGVRHFSREFMAQTGMTPAKAVEKLRIETARGMFEEGHDSISHVSTATGFGDEERMRRAFVRHLGKPPQALIREVRRRESVVT